VVKYLEESGRIEQESNFELEEGLEIFKV